MKPFQAKAVDYLASRSTRQEKATATVQAQTAGVPSKVGNRHQRRQREVLNRKLSKRLKKDGTPAQVKVLDDGGIHISADMRQHEHDETCGHDEEDE